MAEQNNKQRNDKGSGLPEAEEVLTDLEKQIRNYQERVELSYQKKEEKIRLRNANDQEALKRKLERLAKKEEEKLKKVERKLQKKDPKWRKQQKLEKKKAKRAKKAAKKKVKLKKKQIKKQQVKVKKLKKAEAKKHKNDYQYQFSQESARVEQYIAEMEKKINHRIDEISSKEVGQLERLKERYDKMINRGTENIRKSDPEWIEAEKERIAKEKEDAKKKKDDRKVARAEQKAAQKMKAKELREQAKDKTKKTKAQDLKEIRLPNKAKNKAKKEKKERKPFKEAWPEFLARFDYVVLYNGKTVNIAVITGILLLSLLSVLGVAGVLWTQFGPVPAHKVVDRYLLAFSEQDEEMLHEYGFGEYSFIADKIMEQENFAPVRDIMVEKIYDIDYEVLNNGTRVGEQLRVDVQITNYDLGEAMTRGLEQYREENYLAYFSGKYTDADLEDSLVEILQKTMSEAEKDNTETIPVYLAKTADDEWRIVDLGSSNPYLTKMLTGCVYLPLLDENGEMLHIPYMDRKAWTENTPAYQELIEALDEVLKPENAINVNLG